MNLPSWLAVFSIAHSTLALALVLGGGMQFFVYMGLLLASLDYCEAPPPDRYLYPASRCWARFFLLTLLGYWLVLSGSGPGTAATLYGALCLAGGSYVLGSRRWVLVGLLDMFPSPTRRQALAVGVPLLLLGAWVG